MFGIISIDDIDFVGHSLFKNFRLALKNTVNAEFIEVRSSDDLHDVKTLFIVDEHFGPHVNIWKNDNFINTVNDKNIKVIVFNFEKIFSLSFPWNVDHQRTLERFKYLEQFVSDVSDAAALNKKVINKQLLSRDTVFNVVPQEEKNNRILFLGQVNGFYSTRQQVLNDAQASEFPVDIVITERKLTYTQFLQKLNAYTFILNPLGTGLFLNIRFYEALKLNCVPIQQITPAMVNWYKELDQSIPFTQFDNTLKLVAPTTKREYYLEDYFEEVNLTSYL